MLQTLSYALPWNWASSGPSKAPRSKLRKKHVTTRAAQLAANGHANQNIQGEEGWDVPSCYPGLVNVSGTYCFMNSTMQAFASLCYLQPYVDAIQAKAVALDVPTPVTDALHDLLHTLNNPKSSPSSLRPLAMIEALSYPEPGKRSPLFSSREHQDAQELFQLVSECIKKEAAAVDKESLRDRGLGKLPTRTLLLEAERGQLAKGVFDGLTANRRSCMECGYTEAVMHFPFDNWQLSLPRSTICSLQECLGDYTRLEPLTDCICRKCSMVATYVKLDQEAQRLTELADSDPSASSSKKKRAREARKLATRVKEALEQGRIEDDIKGVKMEKVFSKLSTKQAMIARPPPVLALHINRSMHFGNYASKNNTCVRFPEILDLTPYTTSGQLSTVPSVPISTPEPSTSRAATPSIASSSSLPSSHSVTPSPMASPSQVVLYRLSAVVCHYGQHSFGHYVCYRRKPRPLTSSNRFAPPTAPHTFDCMCENCRKYGWVRDADEPQPGRMGTGRGWLRISDASVGECGVEEALNEGSGAFMLYYERVVEAGARPRPRIYSLGPSVSLSSEETVKPEGSNGAADGSRLSILPDGNGSAGPPGLDHNDGRRLGARIVRNVAAGTSSTRSPSSRDVSSRTEEDMKTSVAPPIPQCASSASTGFSSDANAVEEPKSLPAFVKPLRLSTPSPSSPPPLPAPVAQRPSSSSPSPKPPSFSASRPGSTTTQGPPTTQQSPQSGRVTRSHSNSSQVPSARIIGLRA